MAARLSTLGQEPTLAFQAQLTAADSPRSFESYIQPFFICSIQVPLAMLWDHCFQQPLNIEWVETIIGNNICNSDPKFALSVVIDPIASDIAPISLAPGEVPTLDLLNNQYAQVVEGNHRYHYLLYSIAQELYGGEITLGEVLANQEYRHTCLQHPRASWLCNLYSPGEPNFHFADLFHSLYFTGLSEQPVLLKAFMVSLNAPHQILTQSLVDIFLALNDMCEAGESNEMMYVAFLAMSGTRHVPGMPAVIHECELSQVLALMFRQAWFQVDVAAQIWVMWAEKSVAVAPMSSLSQYYLLALSQDISQLMTLALWQCFHTMQHVVQPQPTDTEAFNKYCKFWVTHLQFSGPDQVVKAIATDL